MPEFNLTIRLGNEAMWDHENVAEALERTARAVRSLTHGDYGIFDLNGNKVGSWTMPDMRLDDDEAYSRMISDAAAGDPGELDEDQYLLPRDPA